MTQPTAGMPAPPFEGTDQNGNRLKLSNFLGKKVVLYFYPKDNTPGCTAEACSLRDNYEELLKKGFVVLGVSPDSVASHGKFASKYELPFPSSLTLKRRYSQNTEPTGRRRCTAKR